MKTRLLTFLFSGLLAFAAAPYEAPAQRATVHKGPIARYRLDAASSRFVVDANSSGVLWFMGHNHHIAARDFTGEIQLTPGMIESASLLLRVKADSLAETGERFTEQQKQIITSTMRKQVLETEKYPEIVFKSTKVTTKKKTAENQYDLLIEGDLTLHNVTRRVVIPARVELSGETIRATGDFEFDRDDFNVKTKSIKWGTIRVDDDMKLSFDILARTN
ncbi:MAG TPA: YceI family protein [Blastocatellia bacterium]|nr:YceI family protein [Blastocatellia bacterium]